MTIQLKYINNLLQFFKNNSYDIYCSQQNGSIMLEYMHYAKNVTGFQKMDPNYTCNLVGLFDGIPLYHMVFFV